MSSEGNRKPFLGWVLVCGVGLWSLCFCCGFFSCRKEMKVRKASLAKVRKPKPVFFFFFFPLSSLDMFNLLWGIAFDWMSRWSQLVFLRLWIYVTLLSGWIVHCFEMTCCELALYIKTELNWNVIYPEFDKFLEERAKAAEMTPGVPSPPGSNPGAAQGTPSRKKQERPEGALFAM